MNDKFYLPMSNADYAEILTDAKSKLIELKYSSVPAKRKRIEQIIKDIGIEERHLVDALNESISALAFADNCEEVLQQNINRIQQRNRRQKQITRGLMASVLIVFGAIGYVRNDSKMAHISIAGLSLIGFESIAERMF